MAINQTPSDKQVPINNAAKDDAIGNDGVYQYTYDQLVAKVLANDPGGAAKLADHFFFGASATADHSMTAQIDYLKDVAGFSYDAVNKVFTIDGTMNDFNYFVQIGNKGTWSEATVDVTASHPHASDTPLFAENFDEAPVNTYGAPSGAVASGSINLAAVGWTGTEHNNTSNLSEVAMSKMFGPTEATSGNQFLDTQNTPGQINISHTFTDTTAALDGKTAVLSFDIAKFDIDWGGGFKTNASESFQFQIDGHSVKSFTADELTSTMKHFDIDIMASDYAAGSLHTLSLVNTSETASTIGFAVDSIHINDWIV